MMEAKMEKFIVSMVLRGEVIDGPLVDFGGRRGDVSFAAPDVAAHLDKLTLSSPAALSDLYELRFDDVVDYLDWLGRYLVLDENVHLQQAFELSTRVSGLSQSILRRKYDVLPQMVSPDVVRAMADRLIGIDYLDGWVERPRGVASPIGIKIRAFGARCVHIVAGNVPNISVQTMVWNAITRSDGLIKTPSNDPLTAVAVARTMVDMAPDHPLTKHFSAAYWKGGDERVESTLYDPRRVEKIIAWGGFDGIKHITGYLQPGLDLISLNPKLSSTIIGSEAFADDLTLKQVARRLAFDVGGNNQEACFSARVVYAVTGTDSVGLAKAKALGRATYEAMQKLPVQISTPHKAMDPNLKSELDALRFVPDEYEIIGGGSEGAMIVSQTDAPVDFSALLGGRVANIVPIDDVEIALRSVNAYTQTIGVYPPSLKEDIRDRLSFQGAQRIVALGGANMMDSATPQDGIEPLRRICKWIVEEDLEAAVLDRVIDPITYEAA
jgi:hypothetical protein